MSWYKHDDNVEASKNKQTYKPPQNSFFTDPQSHNENSRSLKVRGELNKEFKNEFVVQSELAGQKREEKLQAKRFNTDLIAKQQVDEANEKQEKENEKQKKLDKQRQYQNELVQQLQDNQERKQIQKTKEDAQEYKSPFNSGTPKHQRDITNEEELAALQAHKRTQKEKQDQYARELAFQLEEQSIKKSSQRKQETEAQYSTGLDIKGSYRYNGPSQKEFRAELALQLEQKDYLKQRAQQRDPYEKPEQANYDLCL